MPTTANYSWPTPADTDLVKDGAEAIRDLGNAIDTTTKAVADAQGLVHINTTSFSAVTSHSVNDVFSSTYDDYKIIVYVLASASYTLTGRFRVSGSDDSTSNYTSQALAGVASTASAFRDVSQSALTLAAGASGNRLVFDMGIWQPFLAEPTGVAIHETLRFEGTAPIVQVKASTFISSTSFTGFSLLSTGNISGTMSIYGYAKV